MKRKLLISLCVFSFGLSLAQIGINTETPLALFHIDGKGDNATTPNSTQTANDAVITTDGNLGIGSINPTNKISIKTNGTESTPIEGFKLTDGNEGIGRFLVSDAQGFATWKKTESLIWNTNHEFTIPHTGIYLITLYLAMEATTTGYANTWHNPTIENTTINAVALWSNTRGNFLIANCDNSVSSQITTSGTLQLNAGEVLRPRAIYWKSTLPYKPTLYVNIIPK